MPRKIRVSPFRHFYTMCTFHFSGTRGCPPADRYISVLPLTKAFHMKHIICTKELPIGAIGACRRTRWDRTSIATRRLAPRGGTQHRCSRSRSNHFQLLPCRYHKRIVLAGMECDRASALTGRRRCRQSDATRPYGGHRHHSMLWRTWLLYCPWLAGQ